MSVCTAARSTVVDSPQLVPAGRVGCKPQGKSGVGRVGYRFNLLVAKRGQGQSDKIGAVKNVRLEPVERSIHFPFVETRKSVMHSTQKRSSAFTCAAALDEKVEQRSPQKMNESNMNIKLNVPEINLDELEKQTHLLVSPRAQPALKKSPSARWNCLCSPATHASSFRCRHHRGSSFSRAGSVGSNLSELARISSAISDSLEAQ